MFNLQNLPVFLLDALILLLTPGPAVLYIIARSLDQGRVAGLVSVIGIFGGYGGATHRTSKRQV